MTEDLIVSGVVFNNRKEYKRALKDEKNIEYIQAKVDMTNPVTLLKLYKKLLEKGTFTTIVGFYFLKQMYDILSMDYMMEDEELPLLNAKDYTLGEFEEDHLGIAEENENYKDKNTDNNSDKKSGKNPAKIKNKKNTNKTEKNAGDSDSAKLKLTVKIMGASIVLLIICIIAMFAITLNSDTVTYSNAKNSVIDEYEQWEQDLNDREKKIEEKEEELGINN